MGGGEGERSKTFVAASLAASGLNATVDSSLRGVHDEPNLTAGASVNFQSPAARGGKKISKGFFAVCQQK